MVFAQAVAQLSQQRIVCDLAQVRDVSCVCQPLAACGANRDVPIFLAHGSRDPVVEVARGLQARDALQALGYGVQWHTYPMEHSVCAEEVADLNAWLLAVLGKG